MLKPVFCSVAPQYPLKAIARGLNLPEEQLEQALAELGQDLEFADRGLRLRRLIGGWRLETKPEHAAAIAACEPMLAVRPLSAQALETLAIVALKQPVTLAEIDAIRGVHSQGTVETLRRRKLIAPAGQPAGAGNSTYWRTTREFLERFDLESPGEMVGYLERAVGPACGQLQKKGVDDSQAAAVEPSEMDVETTGE